MEHWQEIQISYPAEYDYSELSDYTLLQLARRYNDEPNTATLAMGELLHRKNENVEEIAITILNDNEADKFLVASALDDLATVNFLASIEYLNKYAISDEDYLVKEVIYIITYTDDSNVNDAVIKLVSVVNEKVRSNQEHYSEDKGFNETTYNDFRKRYGLA